MKSTFTQQAAGKVMVSEEIENRLPTFFESLTAEQKEEIETLGAVKRFKKGDILFMQGDSSDCVYLINKGFIKAAFLCLDGREIALPFMRPGQILGISSFLNWEQRVCIATAINDVEVIYISKPDFQAFISRNINVAILIIDYLGMRLKNTWKIIEELTSKNVKDRLIWTLFTLSNDFGEKVGDSIVIDINLTHEQIAQMVGTSRQSVTTILNDMENAGVIKKQREKIIINDNTIFDELE